MDIQEVLQVTDELVMAETGKHLTNIQEAVVKGIWQGDDYRAIAKETDKSYSHVKGIASELWEVLSNHLDENIRASNFRSTLSRLHHASHSLIFENNHEIHKVHNCHSFNSYSQLPTEKENKQRKKTDALYHGLIFAPKTTKIYQRQGELSLIQKWLETDTVNIINILGNSGIGKTSLVRKIIDSCIDDFDIVIWRRLDSDYLFSDFIKDLLDTLELKIEDSDKRNIKTLIRFFIQCKCLLVIDNLETLFSPQKPAGNYSLCHRAYQDFFALMAEIENQSKFILISQEKSFKLDSLNLEENAIRCLEMKGFDAVDILKDYQLKDSEMWSNLNQFYLGNPFYLTEISGLINNLFSGSVKEFLEEKDLILTEGIKTNLEKTYERLSKLEKLIVDLLIQQPMNRTEIKKQSRRSPIEIVTGLASLDQRYLLITNESGSFELSPIFKQYVLCLKQELVDFG